MGELERLKEEFELFRKEVEQKMEAFEERFHTFGLKAPDSPAEEEEAESIPRRRRMKNRRFFDFFYCYWVFDDRLRNNFRLSVRDWLIG